jgi:hypothetical protein
MGAQVVEAKSKFWQEVRGRTRDAAADDAH